MMEAGHADAMGTKGRHFFQGKNGVLDFIHLPCYILFKAGRTLSPVSEKATLNPLFGIFLSSFLIAFSGAVMPGPVLTVTISESAKRGFWAGPRIILGHGVLEIALIAAMVLGFADLLKHPAVMGVIGIAGGAVLFWLSYGMV
jgi:hypothetical protein